MSNYSSSYNINQAGDIYAIDTKSTRSSLSKYTSSRATTVNAPVNYRKLMLFRGYDNEFYFFVKTQNGKVFDLRGVSIQGSLINRTNNSKIFGEYCQVEDYETGMIKLVVRSNKISSLENGDCDIILTYTDEQGLTKPLFSDLNMRPAFTCECTDKAGYIPLITQTFTNFSEDNGYLYSGAIQGPAYYEKPNGLVTAGVYCTGYTGKFFIQGTTSPNPSDDDWFDIELGVQNYHHSFNNFTGIEPFSFQSNLNFFRAKIEINTGSVDKLAIRV